MDCQKYVQSSVNHDRSHTEGGNGTLIKNFFCEVLTVEISHLQ